MPATTAPRKPIGCRHLALLLSAALGGCAAIPDLTLSYRPVAWTISASIVHTITCTADGQRFWVQRSAAFAPVYSAGPPDDRFQIKLKELDRFYADAELSVGFTDDGRLKSINQSVTGQGEAVAKAFFTAVTTLSVAQAGGETNELLAQKDGKTAPPAQAEAVCKVVRAWSTQDPKQRPSVALVQTASLAEPGLAAAKLLPEQEALAQELAAVGQAFGAQIKLTESDSALQPVPKPRSDVASDEVGLRLQQIGAVIASASDPKGAMGSAKLPVPLKDSFVLPIPKAALFGKQSFSLSLAESGRIAQIGYGRTSGAAAALGAVNALAGAGTAKDTAEAAALKAAADLIAQQQRLNKCLESPADCK